jgi:CrcB protein
MGLLAGWFAFRGHSDQSTRLFLATGIIGGSTTFSAFSLEAALLLERGQLVGAALYVMGSVVIAIAGIFVGIAIIRTIVA